MLYAEIRAGAIQEIVSDATMERIVQYFMKKYMFSPSEAGSIASEWKKRANTPAHYSLTPTLSLSPGAKASPRPSLTAGALNRLTKEELYRRKLPGQKTKYTQAFKAALPKMYSTIRNTQTIKDGHVGITNFGQLMDLRLTDSMPSGKTTQSRLNSLYMATEFGTGIHQSKAMRGFNKGSRFKVGNKGIWAYTSTGQEFSPLFLGQRPFHMFYDPSGSPRKLYAQLVQKKLPVAMKKIFKEVRRELRSQ